MGVEFLADRLQRTVAPREQVLAVAGVFVLASAHTGGHLAAEDRVFERDGV